MHEMSASKGLVEFEQSVSLPLPDSMVGRLDNEPAVALLNLSCGDSFFSPARLLQGGPPQLQSTRIVRIDSERLVVGRERLPESSQPCQRFALALP